MGKYIVVAAKPKGATNHCNSMFKTYEYSTKDKKWALIGWKSLNYITELLQAKNEILTGRIVSGKMETGAAVEAELRITKNDTQFKISEMPDE